MNLKVVGTENGPAFRGDKPRAWAQQRGIERFPALYYLEAGSLAGRVIRNLKTLLALYPDFKGGWKCALEAAFSHDNSSCTAALGGTFHFAAFGRSVRLAADKEIEIIDKVTLREICCL